MPLNLTPCPLAVYKRGVVFCCSGTSWGTPTSPPDVATTKVILIASLNTTACYMSFATHMQLHTLPQLEGCEPALVMLVLSGAKTVCWSRAAERVQLCGGDCCGRHLQSAAWPKALTPLLEHP